MYECANGKAKEKEDKKKKGKRETNTLPDDDDDDDDWKLNSGSFTTKSLDDCILLTSAKIKTQNTKYFMKYEVWIRWVYTW